MAERRVARLNDWKGQHADWMRLCRCSYALSTRTHSPH